MFWGKNVSLKAIFEISVKRRILGVIFFKAFLEINPEKCEFTRISKTGFKESFSGAKFLSVKSFMNLV